jgi:replicative DNA helicase
VLSYIDEHGHPPTASVLSTEFTVEFADPECDVEWLVEKLRARHLKNKAQEAILKVSRNLGEDPEGAVDEALAALEAIRSQTVSHSVSVTHEDWHGNLAEYYEDLAKGKNSGVTFGFADIDEILGGLRPETLTYVVARPKRCKSWLLLKSAVEAFFDGERVTFMSLELSHKEMYRRFMAMVSGVSWTRMHNGKLTREDRELLAEAEAQMNDCAGSFNLHGPRGGVRVGEVVRQGREDEASVVYIDQLSWLRHHTPVKSGRKHEEVEHINYDLKTATSEFPIYIAAQFNREADSVAEMADLSKIGLSDSIGQIADMVMGLYRNKEMGANHLIEFGAVEARSFEPARFELKVDLGKNSNFKYLRRIDLD